MTFPGRRSGAANVARPAGGLEFKGFNERVTAPGAVTRAMSVTVSAGQHLAPGIPLSIHSTLVLSAGGMTHSAG